MTTIYDKLRSSLFEVQEPLSQGEKNFKGMHNPINHKDIVPGITDQDHIFNGTKRREDPKTASYEKGKDIAAYDKNLKKEEVEQVDEISDRLARSYDKVASKSMDDAAAKGSAGYDTFMKRSKGRALALDKMNQPHKRLKAKVGTTDANAKDAAYRKSVGEELVSEGNPINKEKKNAAAAAVGAKNKDSQYLSRMNPSVADKIRGREKMSGKDRQQYEEVEQVDELSSGVYKSAMNKAAKRAVSDVQGKSGPIHTKYAPMARKFQAKGMEQEKKEKQMN